MVNWELSSSSKTHKHASKYIEMVVGIQRVVYVFVFSNERSSHNSVSILVYFILASLFKPRLPFIELLKKS